MDNQNELIELIDHPYPDLNNSVQIKLIGNCQSSQISKNYQSTGFLTNHPSENKLIIIEALFEIIKSMQINQNLDGYEYKDDHLAIALVGLEIGQPINWIIDDHQTMLQNIIEQGQDKSQNMEIRLTPLLDQQIQSIGIQGSTSVYQLTVSQDIMKANLDNFALNFKDLPSRKSSNYSRPSRSRVNSIHKRQRQSMFKVSDKKKRLKQRSQIRCLDLDQKYISVKPQGVFSVQWMNLMEHPEHIEYFLTDKLFCRGIEGQKATAEKVIKGWIEKIKNRMNKDGQKTAYFSVQYVYQYEALYFYCRIGDYYKYYYTQYQKVEHVQEQIEVTEFINPKYQNRFNIDPVSIDGFQGSFSKFSFGQKFALYEIDMQGSPQIKFIDDFINKRESLTDDLGQQLFEYEIKQDVLKKKILQGYYLAIQRMIQTKQTECYLAINDGNYCTYSESDSQFFRINQVHNDKYLSKQIEKDKDKISLPLTDSYQISYKSNKQEQYIYKLTLQEVEDGMQNGIEENLSAEIKYQLDQLVKCKESGEGDGPWDRYTEEQRCQLRSYRFDGDSCNQIYYQGTSDAVIFLEENDLEGFKLATENQNLKSNTILFQQGKSLLRQCILNNKPEFSQVCLSKLAQKEWKFKLTYDDLIMLITDKKLDDDLKANVLNCIFLPSRVAVDSPVDENRDSQQFNRGKTTKYNFIQSNRDFQLPMAYGIMNLTFRTFQNIVFGTRNSSFFSKISKHLYEQKLIRDPISQIITQEKYQNDIIWLADQEKMTYSKKYIKKIPNIFDDGFSNYAQMRQITNLKQLEAQIDYYTCSFAIHECPFHDESINLMKTLNNVEQVQLFDTDIQYIIDYRWKQSYFFIVVNSCLQIFFGFVMTLSLCLSRAGNKNAVQKCNLAAFILALTLLGRDSVIICYSFYVKQMEIQKYQRMQYGQIQNIYNKITQIVGFPLYVISSYLGDLDEILDMLSQVAYIAYYILELEPDKSQHQNDFLNIFHLITITASLMKGLFVLFRLFERVRYMVFMIKQVITDMIPFTIIFLSVMMMFGVIFLKLSEIDAGYQSDNSANHYVDTTNILLAFKGSIDIMLLGNDQNQETMTGWTMNLMGFVFIQIIMLNLIIAVISDTYANIQSVKQSSAMKSQIRLMIDSLEILNALQNIFKSVFKLKDRKVYINFCKYTKRTNTEKDEDDYHGQVLALKTQVKALQRQIEQQSQAQSNSQYTLQKIYQKLSKNNNNQLNKTCSSAYDVNEETEPIQNIDTIGNKLYQRTATRDFKYE